MVSTINRPVLIITVKRHIKVMVLPLALLYRVSDNNNNTMIVELHWMMPR
jgi:hypothetical protein